MYSVSSGFKSAIMSTSRTLKAKVMINSNTYDETYISDMSFEDASNPSDSFEIGAVASPILTLSLIGVDEVFETATIKPYIGLDLGGTIEYVPLGVFYVDDVDRKKNVVTLTCYDGMIKLEKAYFSSLSYPATITAVMNEICTNAGIQFIGTLPNYSFYKKPEGYTYREVVSFIAQICGGFAKFNRDGKLAIRSYASVAETITADSYVDFSKTKDQAFRVDKVTCQVDDQTISKGTLNAGGSEVTFENPFMTDAILTDVYNKLKGFQFTPIDLQYVGNPAYDVGDIVSLMTIDNETYSIPIMSHKLRYSGGLTGEIQSIGETENSNQFDSSGSISKTVDRVVYEQALINEALINKATIEDLEATNARIDNLITNDLTAVNAAIQNLQADKADITDLNATNARIDNLVANDLSAINAAITNLQADKANITDLNATNARVSTLEADVGSINTLLAGNLGAENFQAGAIYAGSGVIAQGAIGDAEISNLNAGKINAGILNTALVTIQGTNGRLKMADNRFQVFANKTDGSLFERVSLGDVNGDGSVYGLRVRGADGQTVLLDENGVTREGITDGSITDEKIADDANISGTKLDIVSVVTEINEGTTTIQSSKIFYDGKTLDIQLGTMVDTVTSQGQTITNHETRITATEQGLTTKVSVTQYQQDQANLSTQLSQMSTQIQEQANQIALKADASTVYTKSEVDGQFTTINTQITNLSAQLTVQADQIATKVSQTEFDALQIGGRNLWLGEAKPQINNASFWADSGIDSDQNVYVGTKSFVFKPLSGISEVQYLKWRMKWRLNQTYTASVYIYDPEKVVNRIVAYHNGSISTGRIVNIGNDFYRYIVTFTSPIEDYPSHGILVYTNTNLPENNGFYVSGFKFETGNRPTDWTPAPEDVQGQIDEIGSRMTTAETSITQLSNQIALKANQSTVDTLTGQMSSLQAQLTVQAGQIATKVEKDGVISAINQTAESVKIQASKIDLVGAVTVLSDITGNLGTVTAGEIHSVTIISSDATNGTVTIASGRVESVTPGDPTQVPTQKAMMTNGTIGIYNYPADVTTSNMHTEIDVMGMHLENDISSADVYLDDTTGDLVVTVAGFDSRFKIKQMLVADGFVGTDVIENNPDGSGVNIYIRPKNELRVTAPGSTTSYRSLRASNLFGDSVAVNNSADGTNLYVQSAWGGEVRATALGSTTSYVAFRAANLYAASLDTNTGGSVYVRPSSNGSVHITVTGTTNQYRPIYASEHLTGSLVEYKQDIEPMTESALDIVNAARVHRYRLKADVLNGVYNVKYGLIIGDGYATPDEFLSADRTAIDSYVMSAISLKAIQELDGKTTEIADDVEWLKIENDYLKQRVTYLETKLNELEAKVA